MNDNALSRLKRLIEFPSVSDVSNEAVSQEVAAQLEAMDFEVEWTNYRDSNGVLKCNIIGRRLPSGNDALRDIGGLAYFGHTDVVPVNAWVGPSGDDDGSVGDPFKPVLHNGRLYGRGACDMKGSVAAMLAAAANVPRDQQTQPLWIVCTADEEVAFGGARHMVAESAFYREIVAAQPIAVIGEPTMMQVVHGHKGVAGLRIVSHGRAAHSSSDDGINANDAMVPMLQVLREIASESRVNETYHNAAFDPPHLSWNYGVSDFMTAVNITPPRSVAWVNFRPMPGVDGEGFVARVEAKASELGLEVERVPGGPPMWVDPSEPFLGELAKITQSKQTSQSEPGVVCYGTDGCEYHELSRRVVMGPGSIEQAHRHDEWIAIEQLDGGVELFTRLVRQYCS